MNELAAQTSIGLAFLAGLISFLSPCVLPVMPAYLTLISGMNLPDLQAGEAMEPGLRLRILASSAAFVVGFSTVFVVPGRSAPFPGHFLRSFHPTVFGFPLGIAQLAGVVVIAMGLHMAGWLPIPLLYRTQQIDVRPKAVGLLSAFAVGAAFAFGWSPCIGPILGTILTLAGSQDTAARGILLLVAYSAGLAIPFLAGGWSVEFLLRLMKGMRRHFGLLEKGAGVLLIAIGLLMLTGTFVLLNDQANGLLGGVSNRIADLEESLLQ